MKYGFDLDGVLDKPPIAQLARDLHRAGAEIHILTGALADTGEWTLQARNEKIARLAVPCTKLHRCFGRNLTEVGEAKAAVLRQEGIATMIDDSPIYCEAMQQTPAVVMFLMGG